MRLFLGSGKERFKNNELRSWKPSSTKKQAWPQAEDRGEVTVTVSHLCCSEVDFRWALVSTKILLFMEYSYTWKTLFFTGIFQGFCKASRRCHQSSLPLGQNNNVRWTFPTVVLHFPHPSPSRCRSDPLFLSQSYTHTHTHTHTHIHKHTNTHTRTHSVIRTHIHTHTHTHIHKHTNTLCVCVCMCVCVCVCVCIHVCVCVCVRVCVCV